MDIFLTQQNSFTLPGSWAGVDKHGYTPGLWQGDETTDHKPGWLQHFHIWPLSTKIEQLTWHVVKCDGKLM